MPLFIGDYRAATTHLTTLEHGAYLLLIMSYWQRGKPLPSDDERLARMAGVTMDEWKAMRPALAEFFAHGDGVWVHDRIEEELEKARDKSAKAQAAGRKSANARMVVRPTPDEQTLNACSTDVERTPNSLESESEKKKTKRPRRSADSEEVRANLEKVLSPEMAQEVIDHRNRKRSPLTPRAAELLADSFAETGQPEWAAKQMIKHGWTGFEPKWVERMDPPKVVTLVTGPTLPPLKSDYTDEELLADLEPVNACGH
jgi:uncharacterized protein YdaU (DUF1376 family)